MSLEGKTPAESAEVDVDFGRNKWLGLIKKIFFLLLN